jgi:signal transduction histidine kinase
VIGGNVTLALESGTDGALLQPAKRATDRASELVGKRLDFARSGAIHESGESERAIVDMRQPTREAVAMVEQSLDASMTLHAEIADEPLFTATEPGALDRICVNLLFNAREAIDQRRRERPTDPDYHPRIDLTLRPLDRAPGLDGPRIELVVSDNGTGMTAEVRARVFEPFFSTNRAAQSTGLGLATVYGIVSRLGGSFTSTPSRARALRSPSVSRWPPRSRPRRSSLRLLQRPRSRRTSCSSTTNRICCHLPTPSCWKPATSAPSRPPANWPCRRCVPGPST